MILGAYRIIDRDGEPMAAERGKEFAEAARRTDDYYERYGPYGEPPPARPVRRHKLPLSSACLKGLCRLCPGYSGPPRSRTMKRCPCDCGHGGRA